MLRLVVIPLIILAAAKCLPLSLELRQVLVVQAATEVRRRPPLLVAAAEPEEFLAPQVAAEVVDPQEQAELVVQPE